MPGLLAEPLAYNPDALITRPLGQYTPSSEDLALLDRISASDPERGFRSAIQGGIGGTKSAVALALESMGQQEAAKSMYGSAMDNMANAEFIAPDVTKLDQIDGPYNGLRFMAGAAGTMGAYMPLGIGMGVAGRMGLADTIMGRALGTHGATMLGATAGFAPSMIGAENLSMLNDPAYKGDLTDRRARSVGTGVTAAALGAMVPAGIASKMPTRGFWPTLNTNVVGNAAGMGGMDAVSQLNKMDYDKKAKFDWGRAADAAAQGVAGGLPFVLPHAALAGVGHPIAGAAEKVADYTRETGAPAAKGMLDKAGEVAGNVKDAVADFSGDLYKGAKQAYDDGGVAGLQDFTIRAIDSGMTQAPAVAEYIVQQAKPVMEKVKNKVEYAAKVGEVALERRKSDKEELAKIQVRLNELKKLSNGPISSTTTNEIFSIYDGLREKGFTLPYGKDEEIAKIAHPGDKARAIAQYLPKASTVDALAVITALSKGGENKMSYGSKFRHNPPDQKTVEDNRDRLAGPKLLNDTGDTNWRRDSRITKQTRIETGPVEDAVYRAFTEAGGSVRDDHKLLQKVLNASSKLYRARLEGTNKQMDESDYRDALREILGRSAERVIAVVSAATKAKKGDPRLERKPEVSVHSLIEQNLVTPNKHTYHDVLELVRQHDEVHDDITRKVRTGEGESQQATEDALAQNRHMLEIGMRELVKGSSIHKIVHAVRHMDSKFGTPRKTVRTLNPEDYANLSEEELKQHTYEFLQKIDDEGNGTGGTHGMSEVELRLRGNAWESLPEHSARPYSAWANPDHNQEIGGELGNVKLALSKQGEALNIPTTAGEVKGKGGKGWGKKPSNQTGGYVEVSHESALQRASREAKQFAEDKHGVTFTEAQGNREATEDLRSTMRTKYKELLRGYAFAVADYADKRASEWITALEKKGVNVLAGINLLKTEFQKLKEQNDKARDDGLGVQHVFDGRKVLEEQMELSPEDALAVESVFWAAKKSESVMMSEGNDANIKNYLESGEAYANKDTISEFLLNWEPTNYEDFFKTYPHHFPVVRNQGGSHEMLSPIDINAAMLGDRTHARRMTELEKSGATGGMSQENGYLPVKFAGQRDEHAVDITKLMRQSIARTRNRTEGIIEEEGRWNEKETYNAELYDEKGNVNAEYMGALRSGFANLITSLSNKNLDVMIDPYQLQRLLRPDTLLIHGTMGRGDIRVGDIMTPKKQVAFLPGEPAENGVLRTEEPGSRRERTKGLKEGNVTGFKNNMGGNVTLNMPALVRLTAQRLGFDLTSNPSRTALIYLAREGLDALGRNGHLTTSDGARPRLFDKVTRDGKIVTDPKEYAKLTEEQKDTVTLQYAPEFSAMTGTGPFIFERRIYTGKTAEVSGHPTLEGSSIDLRQKNGTERVVLNLNDLNNPHLFDRDSLHPAAQTVAKMEAFAGVLEGHLRDRMSNKDGGYVKGEEAAGRAKDLLAKQNTMTRELYDIMEQLETMLPGRSRDEKVAEWHELNKRVDDLREQLAGMTDVIVKREDAGGLALLAKDARLTALSAIGKQNTAEYKALRKELASRQKELIAAKDEVKRSKGRDIDARTEEEQNPLNRKFRTDLAQTDWADLQAKYDNVMKAYFDQIGYNEAEGFVADYDQMVTRDGRIVSAPADEQSRVKITNEASGKDKGEGKVVTRLFTPVGEGGKPLLDQHGNPLTDSRQDYKFVANEQSGGQKHDPTMTPHITDDFGNKVSSPQAEAILRPAQRPGISNRVAQGEAAKPNLTGERLTIADEAALVRGNKYPATEPGPVQPAPNRLPPLPTGKNIDQRAARKAMHPTKKAEPAVTQPKVSPAGTAENLRLAANKGLTAAERRKQEDMQRQADKFDQKGTLFRDMHSLYVKDEGGLFTAESREKIDEVHAVFDKIFGGKYDMYFEDVLYDKGESVPARFNDKVLSPAGRFMIQLGIHGNAGDAMMTNMFHESVHLLATMLQGSGANGEKAWKQLDKGLNNAMMHGRIERVLKAEGFNPKLIEKMMHDVRNRPEEATAYALSLYAMGKLRVGPETEGVFRRIINFLRTAMRMTSEAARTESFMKAFITGELARGDFKPSLLGEAFGEKTGDRIMQNIKDATKPIIDLTRTVFDSSVAALDRLGEDGKALNALYAGYGPEKGYVHHTIMRSRQFASQMQRVLDAHSSEDVQKGMVEVLAGKPKSEAALKLQQIIREVNKYAGREDIDALPTIWDYDKISKDRSAFQDALRDFGDVDDTNMVRGQAVLDVLRDLGYDNYGKEARFDFKKEYAGEKAKWVQSDYKRFMRSFITQTVNRVEHKKIENEASFLLKKIEKEQGSDAYYKAQQVVDGYKGKLGQNMNPGVRKMMHVLLTVGNVVTLPLALFSASVDPFHIMSRSGGSLQAAGEAYARGIASIPHAIAEMFGGKAHTDEMTRFAEDVGAIEHSMFTDLLGDIYLGDHAEGFTKKVNDWFFRANMLDGWTRQMRVAAVAAAQRFIIAHAKGSKESGHKYSDHYLEELGLTPEDVKIGVDGNLDINDPKMRMAINKFVDEAVVRPDATTNAVWMNDPRFMLIAHMKRFTYAFNDKVLNRAVDEMGRGNASPLLPLIASIPAILMADMGKHLLKMDYSAWMNGASVGDWMGYGAERVGLAGKFQYGLDAGYDIQAGGTPLDSWLGPDFGLVKKALGQERGGSKGELGLLGLADDAYFTYRAFSAGKSYADRSGDHLVSPTKHSRYDAYEDTAKRKQAEKEAAKPFKITPKMREEGKQREREQDKLHEETTGDKYSLFFVGHAGWSNEGGDKGTFVPHSGVRLSTTPAVKSAFENKEVVTLRQVLTESGNEHLIKKMTPRMLAAKLSSDFKDHPYGVGGYDPLKNTIELKDTLHGNDQLLWHEINHVVQFNDPKSPYFFIGKILSDPAMSKMHFARNEKLLNSIATEVGVSPHVLQAFAYTLGGHEQAAYAAAGSGNHALGLRAASKATNLTLPYGIGEHLKDDGLGSLFVRARADYIKKFGFSKTGGSLTGSRTELRNMAAALKHFNAGLTPEGWAAKIEAKQEPWERAAKNKWQEDMEKELPSMPLPSADDLKTLPSASLRTQRKFIKVDAPDVRQG